MEENLSKEINDLKEQILKIKEESENSQNNINNLYEQMKREYDNKIQKILCERDNEINNLTIQNKLNTENLNNEIIKLRNTNLCLQEEIEQNQKKYCNSLNEIQKKIIVYIKKFNICKIKIIKFIINIKKLNNV